MRSSSHSNKTKSPVIIGRYQWNPSIGEQAASHTTNAKWVQSASGGLDDQIESVGAGLNTTRRAVGGLFETTRARKLDLLDSGRMKVDLPLLITYESGKGRPAQLSSYLRSLTQEAHSVPLPSNNCNIECRFWYPGCSGAYCIPPSSDCAAVFTPMIPVRVIEGLMALLWIALCALYVRE